MIHKSMENKHQNFIEKHKAWKKAVEEASDDVKEYVNMLLDDMSQLNESIHNQMKISDRLRKENTRLEKLLDIAEEEVETMEEYVNERDQYYLEKYGY